MHISSPTTFASCSEVDNKATVTASNDGGGKADDSVDVQCPDLSLDKTADDGTVSAGDQIGFTITLSNDGPGTAKNVTINDPLPAGAGISWSIESGPANCSITSATLHCTAVDLADGASIVVHIVSDTTAASCAEYENTASASSSNHRRSTRATRPRSSART